MSDLGEKGTEHYCCYESDIPHGVGVLHECRRARDCKHGSLARSCEICELTKERDEARAEVKHLSDCLQSDANKLAYERDTALADNAKLREQVNVAREALLEIIKGKGRYSQDQFEHCRNTVEDMKALAQEALRRMREKENT